MTYFSTVSRVFTLARSCPSFFGIIATSLAFMFTPSAQCIHRLIMYLVLQADKEGRLATTSASSESSHENSHSQQSESFFPRRF